MILLSKVFLFILNEIEVSVEIIDEILEKNTHVSFSHVFIVCKMQYVYKVYYKINMRVKPSNAEDVLVIMNI